MKLDKIELLDDSAKLLKKYLPKLQGLTELEKSELFTLYSMLKYLSLEFKHQEACLSEEHKAFAALKQNVGDTLANSASEAKRAEASTKQEVIELLAYSLESDFSKEVKDQLRDHFTEYFTRLNQSEMQMYR